MSKRARSGYTNSAGVKLGKQATLRKFKGDLRAISRATAPSVEKAVARAETRLAMKQAGYVDMNFAAGSVAIPGFVTQIGIVPIGAGSTQRVGAKIKWKSVQLRGAFTAGTAADKVHKATLLIVYDRFPGDAKPSVTDILAADTSSGLLNDENRMRFVVVRRIDYMFAPTQQNMPNNGYYDIDEYIKLKGLPCDYKGGATGTGGMGDVRVGALYLVTVGDSVGDMTVNPTLSLNCRVRFADVHG